MVWDLDPSVPIAREGQRNVSCWFNFPTKRNPAKRRIFGSQDESIHPGALLVIEWANTVSSPSSEDPIPAVPGTQLLSFFYHLQNKVV